MTAADLRDKFQQRLGIHWQNSQGEPDIEYVEWLESELIAMKEGDKQPDIKSSAEDYAG